MKKYIAVITLAMLTAIGVQAQIAQPGSPAANADASNTVTTVIAPTNSPAPSTDFIGLSGVFNSLAAAVNNSGLQDATNYALVAYGTYAPSAKTRIGGGFLIPFDFPTLSGTNGAVGMALGMDWLGGWSLVSGNVTLKMETKPLNIGILSFLPASIRNIEAEPILIAGIGSPMNGAAGAATLWDAGYNVKFGHLGKGVFGAGFTWGEWMNAGAESGHRYHIFVDYRIGF